MILTREIEKSTERKGSEYSCCGLAEEQKPYYIKLYNYLFYFLIKTIDPDIVIKMAICSILVNILYIKYINYLYEITN